MFLFPSCLYMPGLVKISLCSSKFISFIHSRYAILVKKSYFKSLGLVVGLQTCRIMLAGHEDHQTHVRKFLVQNSVLSKKLSNSFFVIFFCHRVFKAGSGFPLPNFNAYIPEKINQFHHFESRKSMRKPKDRV